MNTSYFLLLLSVIAVGCLFRVWYRMRSVSYHVDLRHSSRVFAIYRDYWRFSSERKWSRIPLALGIVCILACFYFLLEILPKIDC
jgi:hypothetical protein